MNNIAPAQSGTRADYERHNMAMVQVSLFPKQPGYARAYAIKVTNTTRNRSFAQTPRTIIPPINPQFPLNAKKRA